MKPLDIVRSQEASQIKLMEVQRSHQIQGQVEKGFQNQVENQQKRPVETKKSDNPEYRYDAKEKGNNQYYSNNKKRKDKEDEKKETKNSKSDKIGNGFDMLI